MHNGNKGTVGCFVQLVCPNPSCFQQFARRLNRPFGLLGEDAAWWPNLVSKRPGLGYGVTDVHETGPRSQGVHLSCSFMLLPQFKSDKYSVKAYFNNIRVSCRFLIKARVCPLLVTARKTTSLPKQAKLRWVEPDWTCLQPGI